MTQFAADILQGTLGELGEHVAALLIALTVGCFGQGASDFTAAEPATSAIKPGPARFMPVATRTSTPKPVVAVDGMFSERSTRYPDASL
jgi:hypothetical protein